MLDTHDNPCSALGFHCSFSKLAMAVAAPSNRCKEILSLGGAVLTAHYDLLLSKACTTQVDCPAGYTGPVTVGYASPTVQAVNYDIVESALLVKVTASTAA